MIALLLISPFLVLVIVNGFFLIPKIRKKVVSAAGRGAGISGSAESLSYTPWGGVHITGFRVGDGSAIGAETIRIDLAESKLFSREVDLREISVESGIFSLLYRKPDPLPAVAQVIAPARGDTTPTGESPPVATPPPNPILQKKEGWRTTIGKIRIEDVDFAVRTFGDGPNIVSATGISFTSGDGTGNAFFTSAVSTCGHQFVKSLSGAVQRGANDVFTISDITGRMRSGTLGGSLKFAPRTPGLPFVAAFEIGGLGHPQVDGTGDAVVKIQGGAILPRSWEGQVSVTTEGDVTPKAFPEQRFEQIRLQAVLQGGRINITDARATGTGSSFRASGWVAMSGDLAINLRSYVPFDSVAPAQELAERLLGGTSLNYHPLPPSPLAFTDFALRGSVMNPQLQLPGDHPPFALRRLLPALSN